MLTIAALATPDFVAAAQSLPPEVAQRQQDMKAMAEGLVALRCQEIQGGGGNHPVDLGYRLIVIVRRYSAGIEG
ncbi:hypothetical protein ABIA22_000278 [Sinorhizobium fredii]|nr:hypothetical protein AB395_00003048 [Sinorhizobium fredii CCBAU 45436]